MHKPLTLLILFVVFLTRSGSYLASGDEIIQNARQLTFEGARSGEGYFSQSGNKLVFQSENHLATPFYQIYLLDLKSGESKIVFIGELAKLPALGFIRMKKTSSLHPPIWI